MTYFITLEGSEGVGKSTALNFIKRYLSDKKIDFLLTREPGGTPVGESIRELLLTKRDEQILPETELFLMFSARMQHIAHVIKPALLAKKTVVSDRFTDASFAYQGGGRKIEYQKIETLAHWVQGGLQPDLTLLLDAPVELGLSRLKNRKVKDRIEQEKIDFFQRVREAYLKRAKDYPGRIKMIDATQSLEGVQAQIKATLDGLYV